MYPQKSLNALINTIIAASDESPEARLMVAVYCQALTDYRDLPLAIHKAYVAARAHQNAHVKAKLVMDNYMAKHLNNYDFDELYVMVIRKRAAEKDRDSTISRAFKLVEEFRRVGKYLRDPNNLHLNLASVEHDYVMRILKDCSFFEHDATSCYAASFIEDVKAA